MRNIMINDQKEEIKILETRNIKNNPQTRNIYKYPESRYNKNYQNTRKNLNFNEARNNPIYPDIIRNIQINPEITRNNQNFQKIARNEQNYPVTRNVLLQRQKREAEMSQDDIINNFLNGNWIYNS